MVLKRKNGKYKSEGYKLDDSNIYSDERFSNLLKSRENKKIKIFRVPPWHSIILSIYNLL